MKFIENSEHYVYKDRSCRNCTRRKECPAMLGKDWSLSWLDLGRCGCIKYTGQYIQERRKQDEKD